MPFYTNYIKRRKKIQVSSSPIKYWKIQINIFVMTGEHFITAHAEGSVIIKLHLIESLLTFIEIFFPGKIS